MSQQSTQPYMSSPDTIVEQTSDLHLNSSLMSMTLHNSSSTFLNTQSKRKQIQLTRILRSPMNDRDLFITGSNRLASPIINPKETTSKRNANQPNSLETTQTVLENERSRFSLHTSEDNNNNNIKAPESTTQMRNTTGFATFSRQLIPKHTNNPYYLLDNTDSKDVVKRIQMLSLDKSATSLSQVFSKSKGSPKHNKMQRTTTLEHSYGLPVLVGNKSPSNKGSPSTSFKDVSNLDRHRVDKIDDKLTDKEYYDTSLLTPEQIDQADIIRANRKALQFTYQDDRLHYSKDSQFIKQRLSTSPVGINLDQLDLNKSNLTFDEVKEMVSVSQSGSSSPSENSSQRVPLPAVSAQGIKYKNTTSRKDAQDLELWMNEMTGKLLSDPKLTALQMFKEVQQIYSACLHELSRQVSLQCIERGALMQKIWNSYLNIFKKIIKFKSDEYSNHEKRYLEESKRLHKNYKQRIDHLEVQFKDISVKEESLRERYSEAQSLNSHYLKTMAQLEQQFAQKQFDYNQLQSQSMRTQNDSMKMMLFLREKGFHEFLNSVIDKDMQDDFKRKEFMKAINSKQKAIKQETNHFRSQSHELQNKSTVELHKGDGAHNNSQESDGNNNNKVQRLVLSDPNLYFQNSYKISEDFGNSKATDTHDIDMRTQEVQNKLIKKLKQCQQELKESQEALKLAQVNNTQGQIQTYSTPLTIDYKDNIVARPNTEMGIQVESDLYECSIAQIKDTQTAIQLPSTYRVQDKSAIVTKNSLQMNEGEAEDKNTVSFHVPEKSDASIQLFQNPENNNTSLSKREIAFNISEQQQQLRSETSLTSIVRIDTYNNTDLQQQSKNQKELNQKSMAKAQLSSKKATKSQKRLGNSIKSEKNLTQKSIIQSIAEEDKGEQQGFMLDFFQEASAIVVEDLGEFRENQVLNKLKKGLREIMEASETSQAYLDKFLVYFENTRQYYNKKLIELNSVIQRMQEGQTKMQPPLSKISLIAEEAMLLLSQRTTNTHPLSQNIQTLIDQWKELHKQQKTASQPNELMPKKSPRYLNPEINKIHIIEEDFEGASNVGDYDSDRLLASKETYYFQNQKQAATKAPLDSNSPQKEKASKKQSIPTSQVYKQSSFNFAPPGIPTLSVVKQLNPSPARPTSQTNIQFDSNEMKKRPSVPSQTTISLGKSQSSSKKLPEPNNNSLGNRRQSIINPLLQDNRRAGIVSIKKKVDKSAINPNVEAAQKIVKLILSSHSQSKGKTQASVTRLNLLKFISSVYLERIRVPLNINNSVSTISYEYLLNKYGLRKVAEKKLAQFLESTYAYITCPRIKLFARFSGLVQGESLDQTILEHDEFNFFIYLLKAMDEKTNSGIGLLQNSQDRTLVSLEKITDHLSSYFLKEEKEKTYQSMVVKLQSVSFQLQGQPVIDLDEAFDSTVQFYQSKRLEVENNVKQLFYAADLDKNDCIQLREFLTLYRFLEPSSFQDEQVSHMFFEAADTLSLDGEKALTLERFTSISLEKKLFSIQKQKKFSQAFPENDYVRNIDDLKRFSQRKFKEIKGRLVWAKKYEEHSSVIEHLLHQLSTSNFNENSQKDMLWISYRLLDEDSKRIYIIALAEYLIPEPLNLLCNALKDINDVISDESLSDDSITDIK